MGEAHHFDADVQQLMHLIINAFYSDRDIFLRELLSNASDALAKIRHQSLTEPKVLGANPELKIFVRANKEDRTLVIEDTGVGMTKEELISNLGTVAKSGTRAFMEAMSKGKADSRMIGQFGVGFYSSFLVASRVSVVSKSNEGVQTKWESVGDGSFVVMVDDSKPLLARGTRLTLWLRDDMHAYLEEQRIRSIIDRHCAFINFPIELWTTRMVDVESDKNTVNSESVDNGESAPAKKVQEEVQEYVRINKNQPLWMKNPSTIDDDEYKSFYKAISNDWEDFAAKRHFVGEGKIEFQSILFVPKHPPFEMLMGINTSKKRTNIKLYAKSILIMDSFDEFLPSYLDFVRGVVNSDDIPLNVSRELLQDRSLLNFIAKNLTRRCFDMFEELARDKDAYRNFYASFSANIKLGVYEDKQNRQKLLDLLRFPSSKTASEELISLKEYCARLQTNQKDIYVITGESIEATAKSPFMDRYRKRDIEVLYLVDPIDEYVMDSMRGEEYDGRKFLNITREGIQLESEEDATKESLEKMRKEHEGVCAVIKKVLGASRLEKVDVSTDIEGSPCALVAPQFGHTANMERLMRSQALQSQEQRYMLGASFSRRTMLINPSHSIIASFKEKVGDVDGKSERIDEIAKEEAVKEFAYLLFDTATLSSGYVLDDPGETASRIHRLMSKL